MSEGVILKGVKLPTLPDDFYDPSLFKLISSEGFLNTRWDDVPDELLIYVFLHDEPVLGKKRRKETKAEYYRDLMQFLQFAKAKGGIRHIQPEHLLAYQLWLEGNDGTNNYKPTTIRKKSTVIKQFYQYLFRKGVIQSDITYKMKKVAQPKELLVNRDLYEHEVQQLIDYFRKNDLFAYTLLLCLVSTGMRIEELATAKWRRLYFHLELGCYFLPVIGKGNKVREVRIFEDVLDPLKELRRRRGLESELNAEDSSAFFPKADGGHYNKKYLGSEFTKLIKETGFPFVKHRTDPITPHTCRHYTAAYFAKKGIELDAIRDMLGHASIKTTERYLWKQRRLEDHAAVQLGERFINN